jgi:carbon storage regulator
MLVLSRKKGERVIVARSIVVTVLEVKQGTVRLGIDAPADVRILRHELQAAPGGLPEAPEPLPTPT